MTDYYEDYWSMSGFRPTGTLYPALGRLLGDLVGPTDSVLDVGCGDGRSCGLWARENAGSYLGLDVSATALEAARSLGLDVEQISDASELPVDDGAFDVVVSLEVLEHLFEPQKAAAEILRAVRPGGMVLVTVPNIAHWRQRAELLVGRWNPYGDDQAAHRPWRDPHIRFFTPRTLARMLVETGLEVQQVGAFSGPLLHEIPGFRKLVADRVEPGAATRAITQRMPSVFGRRVFAIARRPA